MVKTIIIVALLAPLSVMSHTGANLQLQNAEMAASINQKRLTNASVSQKIQQRIILIGIEYLGIILGKYC